MTKCQYEYRFALEKKCPHETIEGKNICYWHEKRTDKDPVKELGISDFSKFDLEEAFLKGAKTKNTCLEGVNLKNAYLQKANLYGAKLEEAYLHGTHLSRTDLRDAKAFIANFQRADLGNSKLQGINLAGAYLQETYLVGANLRDANLANARFDDADFYFATFDNSSLWSAKYIDEVVINEREGDNEQNKIGKLRKYGESLQIYRNLKNYFRNQGIHELSGTYYYREKMVEKKIYSITSKQRYLGSLFLDILCGYGEKPWRIITSSIAWVFFNSFMFFILGIETGAAEIRLSLQSSFLQNVYSFLNCLYFSFVTFTTLGYGDLHPTGITKVFATIEAFTGAFMIALFVLTMGRKMMR